MAALAYLDSWISELESSDVKRTDPSTSIVEANSLAFLDEFINELTPCAKARAARKEKGKEKDKGKGGPGKPGKKPPKAVDAGPDFTELHAGHLEMRVGVIVEAWEHPDSEKLWCERIDVGESEVREIASGLRAFYKLEDMKGARVVVLCNLKIKKLGGFPSNGMVMCASNTAHDEVGPLSWLWEEHGRTSLRSDLLFPQKCPFREPASFNPGAPPPPGQIRGSAGGRARGIPGDVRGARSDPGDKRAREEAQDLRGRGAAS